MFAERSLSFLIEEAVRVLMDIEDTDSVAMQHQRSASQTAARGAPASIPTAMILPTPLFGRSWTSSEQ